LSTTDKQNANSRQLFSVQISSRHYHVVKLYNDGMVQAVMFGYLI